LLYSRCVIRATPANFCFRAILFAPVPPRFTNFLASEIRAKVFVTGE
jgi:hypothetical protein